MASKKMVFHVFDIECKHVTPQAPKLSKELYSALNGTETTLERMMKLSSEQDSKDSDFISNFHENKGYLFGSFVRLNEGEESRVLIEQLKQKTVEINKIVSEADEGTAGSVKDTVFFCCYEDVMVMNSAHNNQKALSTYINWLLTKDTQKELSYNFNYRMNTTTTIPIQDVKSIRIGDTYLNKIPQFRKTRMSIGNSVLKHFFSDIKLPTDFEYDDIISATLNINLKKKAIEKQDALNTALRIVDDPNVTIVGRNGNTIKGSQYKMKATREIERTMDGYFNEKEIESNMREIIRAVRSGEVVS